MVGIADLFGIDASRSKHFNRPAILAPLVMKVSNVVVRLSYQHGHVVLGTELAGLLVRIQSFGKFTQTDVASSHVAEDRGNPLGILLRRQSLIRTLIASQSLCKSVLPVVDVADVDLETRESPGVAFGSKDLTRAFPGGE